MTDQEQALRLILAEYYLRKKGWRYWNYCGNLLYKVEAVDNSYPKRGYNGDWRPFPKLTDPSWLFELLDFINIQHIMIDPTAEGTWVCGISIDGREWFKGIGDTRELALAQCLGKKIKEEG